jgi:predicted Ser/Thr protein kinase
MTAKDDLSKIVSKEDLADFIETLRDNFVQSSSEWENPTMDRYLDAMAAWVRDMDGYYRNAGENPPIQPTWRTVADILVAAKIYE